MTILAADASFPIGVAKTVGNTISFVQPFNFSRFDFEGLEVFFEADATLDRPRFHVNSTNAHMMHVGELGHAPNVTIFAGDMDAADLKSDVGEAAVQIATGSLTTKRCNWHDAPRDYCDLFTGAWSMKGDVFGLAGFGLDQTGHEDGVGHIYGGRVYMDGVLVDFRLLGQKKLNAGWTGQLYLQPEREDIHFTARRSTFLGATDNGLLYPIQTNERSFGVFMDVQGCMFEPGIHGHVIGDTPAAGGKVSLVQAANMNAITLQPFVTLQ
jgi:hypothetical protein